MTRTTTRTTKTQTSPSAKKEDDTDDADDEDSDELRLEEPTLLVFGSTEIVDIEFTVPAARGGTPPYRYEMSSLPDGLSFNSEKRTVKGRPADYGRYRARGTITDATGASISFEFHIIIGFI